jgi:hypothetical protein
MTTTKQMRARLQLTHLTILRAIRDGRELMSCPRTSWQTLLRWGAVAVTIERREGRRVPRAELTEIGRALLEGKP